LSRHPATRSDVLASDADRELTVGRLREHFSAGRLDHRELELRIERCYAAATRGELRRVVADLPHPRATTRFYRFQRELLPYHAGAYVSINGALVGIWAAAGEGSFWPAGVLAPTTVAIVWHAVASRWLRRRLASRRR
jgi:hypothetical protein